MTHSTVGIFLITCKNRIAFSDAGTACNIGKNSPTISIIKYTCVGSHLKQSHIQNKTSKDSKPLRAANFINNENLTHFKMSCDEYLEKDSGKEVFAVFKNTESYILWIFGCSSRRKEPLVKKSTSLLGRNQTRSYSWAIELTVPALKAPRIKNKVT